jgi:hypothetical protein
MEKNFRGARMPEGVHNKILVRLCREELTLDAVDEIPPESPLCKRGEAQSAGGFVC